MSGLFGSKPAPPAAPAVLPVSPIPDPNSPAVLEARRNAENKLIAQAGRSATVLTTAVSRGGSKSTVAGSGGAGAPYANTTLGGGS